VLLYSSRIDDPICCRSATLNCNISNNQLDREHTDNRPEGVAVVGTQPTPDCNIEYFGHVVRMLFEIEVELVATVVHVVVMEQLIDIVKLY